MHPNSRGLNPPYVMVRYGVGIDQTRRTASLRPRNCRHFPVLTHEWKSGRRTFARNGDLPKISFGSEEEVSTIGHPCGSPDVQTPEWKTLRFADCAQIFSQLKQVNLSLEFGESAAEDQRTAVWRQRRAIIA